MPRGDKSAYTAKQKRQAEHIAESAEDAGHSKKEAKAIGWATVNKQSGGGIKSGSGHVPTKADKSETAREAAISSKTGTTSAERHGRKSDDGDAKSSPTRKTASKASSKTATKSSSAKTAHKTASRNTSSRKSATKSR